MYGEIFNYKILVDQQQAKNAAKTAFEVLAGGNDYFDFLMF